LRPRKLGGSISAIDRGPDSNRNRGVPGPYAGALRISSYGEVEEVLRSAAFVQAQHQESSPFLGRTLIVLDGEAHFQRRRIESALFTREALIAYERDVLRPSIDGCLSEAFAASVGPEAAADLIELMRGMLLRITAAISGVDAVDNEAAAQHFREFLPRLGEGSSVEYSTRDHADVIRETLVLRDKFVADFYGSSLTRRQALVAQHRAGTLDAAALPRDLMTVMLDEDAPDYDVDQILRETSLYLVAATQTSTNALPHVLLELDDWLSEHPHEHRRLDSGTFLRAAVSESLRLHVPVPALLRRATEEVTLSTGRRIPNGSEVACEIAAANRDVSVFGSNSERFDPDRVPRGRVPLWGLAFGAGEHLCIGRVLAMGLQRGRDEDVTYGILPLILRTLLRADVRQDPERPPTRNEKSAHDAYSAFPILLRARDRN
jgi:cytochrome P450